MPSPRPLRLMTWNVRSLRDDRDAVVRVVRTLAPDLLFVQEAPRFLRARSRLAGLARECGLVVAAGARPVAGVAVLAAMRLDIDAPASHLLTKTSGLHQRGVAVAEATLGQRRFVAASVHLGLRSAERQRHAAEIAAILADRELPAVVAGDLNEGADGSAWARLLDGRVDVGSELDLPTFPAEAPRRRIDAVMVPPDWGVSPVSPAETVGEADLICATDHRPVVVDVAGPL